MFLTLEELRGKPKYLPKQNEDLKYRKLLLSDISGKNDFEITLETYLNRYIYIYI